MLPAGSHSAAQNGGIEMKSKPIQETKTLDARLRRDFRKNKSLYLMVLPVLAFYIYFCYKPMYGVLIAFQDFNFRAGMTGSPWVGLENFRRFFADPYFFRNIKNTLVISLASIVFGFPAPILLALLINEVGNRYFKKTVQTITYMPYFISLVVLCSMVKSFVASDGIITRLVNILTGGTIEESMLNYAGLFVPIYVISDIWQQVGWGSIIYLAALSGIDQELYDAADVDGAGHIKKLTHVTLPCLSQTIIVLLILRLGGILSVGYEKIILLTNAYNAENSEILSYYIYKKGIAGGEYGLATAAGLFNSVINCIFVVGANYISRKFSDTSLW